MPQFDQLPRPIVACAAGLDADQTWLKTFEEGQDLRPSQRAVEYNLTMTIDTVDMKNVLSQPLIDCFAINCRAVSGFIIIVRLINTTKP